jgi:4-amino-4-deoxy-L-arabinose transferase-like glycosyltransferase
MSVRILLQENSRLKEVPRILNKEWIVLFSLVLFAILLRTYHAYKAGIGFSPDSAQYLYMAANFIDHGQLASFGATFPDIMRPVLYPLFVAAIYLLTGNILLSGVIVSIVAGGFTIVAVYFIAKELFDHRTAFIAAILAAINYHLIIVSTYCWTDSLALFFLLLGYLSGLKLIRTGKYTYAILAGVFFVLGFLTRQIVEIHFYSFVLFYILTIIHKKDYMGSFKRLMVLLFVLCLVLSPYLYFTYKETGRIVVNTGKDYVGVKSKVLKHKKVDGFYQKVLNGYENVSPVFKKQLVNEIGNRALNDGNNGLLAFDYYFKRIDTAAGGNWIVEGFRNRAPVISRNLTDLFVSIRHTFGFFSLFMLAGMYFCLKEKRYSLLLFFCFATVADVMFIARGHYEDRYAINIMVFFLIVVAYGIRKTIRLRKIREKHSISGMATFALALIALCLSLWSVPDSYRKGIGAVNHVNSRINSVVNAFKAYIEPDSLIAARQPTCVFLLSGKYVPLPIADFNDTVEYLSNEKAKYLLLSPRAIRLRPFLATMVLNESPSFQLVKKTTVNNEEWFLYKRLHKQAA